RPRCRASDVGPRTEARDDDAGGGRPGIAAEDRMGDWRRGSLRIERGVRGAGGRGHARGGRGSGAGERAWRRRRARPCDRRERRARPDDVALRAAASRQAARHRHPVPRRRQWRRARGRGAQLTRMRIIGVVGAGTMGSGIAQAFAQSGFDVRLYDTDGGALDRARGTIEKSLAKFVEKAKITAAQKDEALARVQPSRALEDLAAAEFIVEAAIEQMAAK